MFKNHLMLLQALYRIGVSFFVSIKCAMRLILKKAERANPGAYSCSPAPPNTILE